MADPQPIAHCLRCSRKVFRVCFMHGFSGLCVSLKKKTVVAGRNGCPWVANVTAGQDSVVWP